MPPQTGSEAVDEDAGRPEPGQLYDRRRSELDQRPERHPLEVQAGGGNVLAEFARSDLEAIREKGCEELGRDQVDLPQIWEAGLVTGQIAVPDERAGVGITFHAMAFHQHYVVLCRFAEVVPAISGDRHHPSFEREVVRVRHQAALASERRFCRK
nr:hypothetical protein [Bradyrhizobium liaoningense]